MCFYFLCFWIGVASLKPLLNMKKRNMQLYNELKLFSFSPVVQDLDLHHLYLWKNNTIPFKLNTELPWRRFALAEYFSFPTSLLQTFYVPLLTSRNTLGTQCQYSNSNIVIQQGSFATTQSELPCDVTFSWNKEPPSQAPSNRYFPTTID